MDVGPDRETIRAVALETRVLRPPKQRLATFGVTSIEYYLLSEPSYAGLLGDDDGRETVIRTGVVVAERPQIVTPFYLLNLFQGFEHGRQFADYLMETYGANSPGLMYSYKNEPKETSIVSDPMAVVAGRISEQIDEDGTDRAAIVQGVDQLWDISLAKFIHELTLGSLGHNVKELSDHGLLEMTGRVPRATRERIRLMFEAVRSSQMEPSELKAELDRWGLWEEYEDRFLDIFRRR